MQTISQQAAAHFLYAERLRHGTHDQVWITNAGKCDKHHPVCELVDDPSRDLHCQAGFADAARSKERYQTRRREQVAHFGDRVLATDEAAERRGQRPGVRR
jgi:hypothetical protein